MLGTALRLIGEEPELQQQLRDDRSRIPAFVEEVVRLESPIQGNFRMARHHTSLGGVDIPAGTSVMVLEGAANHDPRQFECPAEMRLDRTNGRQHIGFGFGIHTCAGAPLAHAEGRGEPGAHPRPHGRHPRLRGATRTGRRAPLPVHADLHAARSRRAAPGVHADRMTNHASITPYLIHVDDTVLDDLRDRLGRARLPDELDDAGSDYGIPTTYVRDLVTYWRDEYDWRAQEARLNDLDHFRTEIDGQEIHFVHARSARPDAIPLLLTHGWPGSIVEFLDAIPLLTDTFHVVAPSLPGYGFSAYARRAAGMSPRIAMAFAELMARLGYERYGAQGGDWAPQVATRIGALDAQHCAGIHLNMPLGRRPTESVELSDDDTAGLAALAQFTKEESGYALEQSTKPQTLGVALNDSPAGRSRGSSRSSVRGAIATAIPSACSPRPVAHERHHLLGDETITSSARLYWEHMHSADRPDYVAVPTGVGALPEGDPALPAAVGGALVQRHLLGRDAPWRPLRSDGTTRAVRQRPPHLLHHPPLLIYASFDGHSGRQRTHRSLRAHGGDDAAVDQHVGAGDERRRRAHEEFDHRGDVVGRAEPARPRGVDHRAIAEPNGPSSSSRPMGVAITPGLIDTTATAPSPHATDAASTCT